MRRQPVAAARSGRTAAALFCAWLAVSAFPAAAQDTEWNRYTLDGLLGLHVRAETNEGCLGAGVSSESVRAGAETLLASAGIPLLTRDEMLASPGLPELRITFECGGGVAGVVGYAVSVRVQQATQMIRDTQITLSEAVTWFATAVGVADAADAADAMSDALRTQLADFAQAFEEANADDEGERS